MIEESGAVIAFWVLSAGLVGSALMVMLQRNLLHAVLFLVLAFLCLSGLYIVLSADFVAMAQIPTRRRTAGARPTPPRPYGLPPPISPSV